MCKKAREALSFSFFMAGLLFGLLCHVCLHISAKIEGVPE